MANTCGRIFADSRLKDLKLRYFDPTLSAAGGHEDKGVIECLTVTCAKGLVYCAGDRESPIVADRAEDVSELLHHIFENKTIYRLEQSKPGFLGTRETLTDSVVRLQTNDELVAETFWNHCRRDRVDFGESSHAHGTSARPHAQQTCCLRRRPVPGDVELWRCPSDRSPGGEPQVDLPTL